MSALAIPVLQATCSHGSRTELVQRYALWGVSDLYRRRGVVIVVRNHRRAGREWYEV